MSDTKPKPFLTIDQRCACGSTLSIELPQEVAATYLAEKLFTLMTAWTTHHGHGPTLEKMFAARESKS